MMNFMFILMLLMAVMMAWWLIPVAFVIWIVVKFIKGLPTDSPNTKEDTIYL